MPRLRYEPDNDYYLLLGVPATASAEEIQRAFRRLAKELHPDHNLDRSGWATAAFQAINEAYAVLSDPALRRQYDTLRWPHARPASPAGSDGSAPRWDQPYARPRPSPPRSTAPATPWGALVALLRGPFGYIYLFVALLLLMLVVSYAALTQFAWYVRTSATVTLLAPVLTSTPGVIASPTPAGPTLAAPTCGNPRVTISEPADGARVPSLGAVYGSADPPGFQEYRLELAYLGGSQADPTVVSPEWVLLGPPSRQPVSAGVLAEPVDFGPLEPGVYRLRLTVQLDDGTVLPPCERVVFLDRDLE